MTDKIQYSSFKLKYLEKLIRIYSFDRSDKVIKNQGEDDGVHFSCNSFLNMAYSNGFVSKITRFRELTRFRTLSRLLFGGIARKSCKHTILFLSILLRTIQGQSASFDMV